MPFMSFKMVNAKNFNMEWKKKLLKYLAYLFTEILIIS